MNCYCSQPTEYMYFYIQLLGRRWVYHTCMQACMGYILVYCSLRYSNEYIQQCKTVYLLYRYTLSPDLIVIDGLGMYLLKQDDDPLPRPTVTLWSLTHYVTGTYIYLNSTYYTYIVSSLFIFLISNYSLTLK